MAATRSRRKLVKHAEKPRPRRMDPPPPEDFEGPDVTDLFLHIMDKKKEEEALLEANLLRSSRIRSRSVDLRSVITTKTSASRMRMDDEVYTSTPVKKESSEELSLKYSEVPEENDEVKFKISGTAQQRREAVRCIAKRLEYDPSSQGPDKVSTSRNKLQATSTSQPPSATSTPVKSPPTAPLFAATKKDEDRLRYSVNKSALGLVNPSEPSFKARRSSFHGLVVDLPSVETDLHNLASLQPLRSRNISADASHDQSHPSLKPASSSQLHSSGPLPRRQESSTSLSSQSEYFDAQVESRDAEKPKAVRRIFQTSQDASSGSKIQERQAVEKDLADRKQPSITNGDLQRTVLELKGIGNICLETEKVDIMREAISALCKHFGNLVNAKGFTIGNHRTEIKANSRSHVSTTPEKSSEPPSPFSIIYDKPVELHRSHSSQSASVSDQDVTRPSRSRSFSYSSRSMDSSSGNHAKYDPNNNNSDGPSFICTWDTSLQQGSTSSPARPYLTKSGDISEVRYMNGENLHGVSAIHHSGHSSLLNSPPDSISKVTSMPTIFPTEQDCEESAANHPHRAFSDSNLQGDSIKLYDLNKSDSSPVVLLREPICPDMSRSEIATLTRNMPSGQYTAKFRRRMFRQCRKDRQAREGTVFNFDMPSIQYSREKLLQLAKKPECFMMPEEWSYLLRIYPLVCLTNRQRSWEPSNHVLPPHLIPNTIPSRDNAPSTVFKNLKVWTCTECSYD